MNITPELYIKRAIIETVLRWGALDIPLDWTAESIQDKWIEICSDEHPYDAQENVRCSGEKTNITPSFSRNYEVDQVAMLIGGKWVGWSYYYGGGKHSNPSEVDWMEYAYFLDLEKEEEIITIKRTFKKSED